MALITGSAKQVAIGLNGCREPIEEFDLAHTPAGLSEFFKRVRHHESLSGAQVCVAMVGFGGYARPIDTQVLAQGWRLYAINNLKFARFKEIFPAPAKTDAIDARRMLQLMQMRGQVPMAEALLQEVAPVDRLHRQLKALTRRRKQLVAERMSISQRMQAELLRCGAGLLAITGQRTTFGSSAFTARKICEAQNSTPITLLRIPGVGVGYATRLRAGRRTPCLPIRSRGRLR